jgi:Protein of unknown function (DUF2911)
MNKYKLLSIAVAILSALPLMAQPQPAANRAASTGGASPHETTGVVIGDRRTGCRVTITYGRPYSKRPGTTEVRKIWGGLVPWGKAWRLGSDEATTLITQQPLVFGGTTVPAGAYTLYMIPEESGTSKLAISKKIGQWGVPVDESQDLARVDLKKDTTDKPYDQFTMAVERDQATGGGVIKMMWENTQFSVPFTVQKP